MAVPNSNYPPEEYLKRFGHEVIGFTVYMALFGEFSMIMGR
jgi:hypothetical protein